MSGESFYHGVEKLVFCADIGTTQSAVTLIHLLPGSIPRVKLVSSWPGAPGEFKTPSIILYDAFGIPRACGASVLEESVQVTAENEGWWKCELWKASLHQEIATLPPSPSDSSLSSRARYPDASYFQKTYGPSTAGNSVTSLRIYGDWISYLVTEARLWFGRTVPDGATVWEKLERTMEFVLSHPNGWNSSQQLVQKWFLHTALLNAVPSASLEAVGETDRVVFVSEGHAAAHYAAHYASSGTRWLAPRSQFLVVDAGASTTNISAYVIEQTKPKLKVTVPTPSVCVQPGGIFPTHYAMNIIKAKLAGSKFDDAETLADIKLQFDTKTKLVFDDPAIDHHFKVGNESCNDLAKGISRGRLTLKGFEVAASFKPSVDSIFEGIHNHIQGTPVTHIFLYGGFGESPYLQRRLRETYGPGGIRITTSDQPAKKAVVEGAAFYYLYEKVVAPALDRANLEDQLGRVSSFKLFCRWLNEACTDSPYIERRTRAEIESDDADLARRANNEYWDYD